MPFGEIEIVDRSTRLSSTSRDENGDDDADEEVLGRQLSLEGSSNSPLPCLPKVAAAAADILLSSQLSKHSLVSSFKEADDNDEEAEPEKSALLHGACIECIPIP